MSDQMAEGRAVTIAGFGRFEAREYKDRRVVDLDESAFGRAWRQTKIGKTARRWYLPKLHYRLAFSLEDAVRQEVVR